MDEEKQPETTKWMAGLQPHQREALRRLYLKAAEIGERVLLQEAATAKLAEQEDENTEGPKGP